jgi:hypothetical protein
MMTVVVGWAWRLSSSRVTAWGRVGVGAMVRQDRAGLTARCVAWLAGTRQV